MLRPGDRVYINESSEEAVVNVVHTHEVLVRVFTPDGHDDRTYPHDRLRLAPTERVQTVLYAF